MSFDGDLPQDRSTFARVLPANQKTLQTEPVPVAIPQRGLTKQQMTGQSSHRLQAVQNADLARALAGTFQKDTTTALRVPVVIKAEKKKAAPTTRHLSGSHRLTLSLLGSFLLLLVTGGTLFAVSPLNHDAGMGWSFYQNQVSSNLVQNKDINPSVVLQATATAVFHQKTDGYDPRAGTSPQIVNSGGSLNWPVGQCTYWANYRYHQLTGYWVSWSGNADQWVAGARMAHWQVSTTPHIPSIIVLMPGVEGASSAYGHVAVAEKLINSTTVYTTTMNWYANGGGFNIESTWNFTTGSGVYFVWHP